MTTSAGAESALYHKESWVNGANRLAAEPSLEFGRFRCCCGSWLGREFILIKNC
jgi:hypothetical protein